MKDTTLTIKHAWSEVSVTFSNSDVNLEQYFSAFKGMLVSLEWRESMIDEFIIELGKELEDLKNFKNE